MADTVRTRAALLALLADNSVGDISAQDLRDLLVTLHGVYGSIYTLDGSTAQSGISGTPAKMTGFATNGEAVGVTPDQANAKLTIVTTGIYKVDFFCSFSGTASKTFDFHVRKGANETCVAVSRKLGSGGDVGSAGATGIVSCTAADELTVYVESSDGGSSITPVDLTLMAHKIG